MRLIYRRNYVIRERPINQRSNFYSDNWRTGTHNETNPNQSDQVEHTVKRDVQISNTDDRTEHGIFTVFEYASAIGPGSKLPITLTEVNDMPTIALCNSGTTCSFMKRFFLEKSKTKYPSAKLDKIGVERTTLKSVDGNNIKIKGLLY